MPGIGQRFLAAAKEPGKLRHAIVRRWFLLAMRRIEVRPVPSRLLGTDYGGWAVVDGLPGEGWTAWCVGAGDDTSFEQGLLRRGAAEVRSFDPFDAFARIAAPQVDVEPRWTFHTLAIAARDGPIEMFGRQDDVEGAVSADPALHGGERFVRDGRTIASLMAEFGTRRIDLLKLDVEGIEYDVVPTLDLEAMGVQQFSVELHENGGVRAARRLLSDLHERGFRVVHRRRTADFTLVRADVLERLTAATDR